MARFISVHFSKPPVVEVVLGLQFNRAKASVSDLGAFASLVRDQYPDVVDAPAIPRTVEVPDGGFSFPRFAIQTAARIQMYERSRQHFLQLQTDRFHANWQRANEQDDYPHFDEVWRRFADGWKKWKACCAEAPPAPIQYEVTYVNHVYPGELWQMDQSVSRVLPWLAPPLLTREPEVESAFHYWIPECRGRLHVVARTARRLPELKPVLVFELTLRGSNAKLGSDDDLEAWMDAAHKRIGDSFMKLTSPDAHRVWVLAKGGA